MGEVRRLSQPFGIEITRGLTRSCNDFAFHESAILRQGNLRNA
jgi:hypothetical protein